MPKADCGEPLLAWVPAPTSPRLLLNWLWGREIPPSHKSCLHLSDVHIEGTSSQAANSRGIHLSQLTEELRVWSSHSTPSHRRPHLVSELAEQWRGVQMPSCCLVAHLNFRVCFQEHADSMGDICMSSFHRQKGSLTRGLGNED